MTRKILIVDDVALDRQMLKSVLSKDYDIIEAENGDEALAKIRMCYKYLSAVLLDIYMPGVNGYDVLRRIRENPVLSQLPVIIVSGLADEASRVQALALGANDYITKPYNTDIIKHCLRNNIMLHETVTKVNAVPTDKLTGVFNREFFFEKADSLIKHRESGYYIISGFDIDNFKMINDQFGAAEGDRILRYIGKALKETFDRIDGLCGRISGDNFACLFPNTPEIIEYINEGHAGYLPDDISPSIVMSFGRCIVTDTSLPASTLYDRAFMAKHSVKGRYDKHMAYFDDSMLEELVKEQQLTKDMETAVERRQFEVWYQPQYNHTTGDLIGAEALVRWRHPEKGLIQPGDFLPIFERNGFIYELDKYVIDTVCGDIRRWFDNKSDPVPVSVNISRYDIFKDDLIDVLKNAVDVHGIPIDMLRIEVTESVFSKSTQRVVTIIKKLISLGFTIEIDDFGSGYSSLNTLKDVPAQILKLDMRFMDNITDTQRAGNVIESIIRMAKWLNMSVIAEGVETVEQADFLKSNGCNQVQGFLYAKSMPADEYEKLTRNKVRDVMSPKSPPPDRLNDNTFWDPRSVDMLIFNSYVGKACIFEFCANRIEILRVNDKFIQMLNAAGISLDAFMKLNPASYLSDNDLTRLGRELEESADVKREFNDDFVFNSLPGCPAEVCIHATLRVIVAAEDRYLVYCLCDDVTRLHESEKKRRVLSQWLSTIMDNINSGITAVTVGEAGTEVLFVNEYFFRMFGYTKRQYRSEGKDINDFIHPDDRERITKEAAAANEKKEPFTLMYRGIKCDGSVIWLCGKVSFIKLSGIDTMVQLASTEDITARTDAEFKFSLLAESIPGGLAAFELKPGSLKMLFCNEGFYRAYGYTKEEYESSVMSDPFEFVFEEDRADAMQVIASMRYIKGETKTGTYRCHTKDGGYRWFSMTGTVVEAKDDTAVVYILRYDVTEQKEAEQKLRESNLQLRLLSDNIAGGIATYTCGASDPKLSDIKIIYYNDGYYKLFETTHEEFEATISRDPLVMVCDEDKAILENQLVSLMKEDNPKGCLFRAHSKSGGFRWISHNAEVIERQSDKLIINAMLIDVTEQQNAMEKLRMSEEENRIAVSHSGNTICRYLISEKQLVMTQENAKRLEIPQIISNVPYGPAEMGYISHESMKSYISFYEDILSGKASGQAVYRIKLRNEWRWIEAHYSTICTNDGKPSYAVVSFFDVTDRIEKDIIYKKWQQSLHEREPGMYMLFCTNLKHSTSFDILGGTLLSHIIGDEALTFNERTQKYADLFVFRDDREKYLAFMDSDTMSENYHNGKRNAAIEYREERGGELRWLRLTTELVEFPNSTDIEAYLLYENINASKTEELETIKRAENDSLTGLLNRNTFAEKMKARIAERDGDSKYALFMFDIDGFKQINDTLGHAAGDEVLVKVARIVRNTFRKQDLFCRFGGDEYMVCLCDFPNKAIAVQKAEQLRSVMHIPLDNGSVMSVSLGIALCPDDGCDFNTLYRKADAALYTVKENGKNDFAFYEDGMTGETD